MGWAGACPKGIRAKSREAFAQAWDFQEGRNLPRCGLRLPDPSKLACLVYRMLEYGTEYVKQSMQEYEQRVRTQLERALKRKAAALGYQLVPNPPRAPEPASVPASS